LPDRLRPGEGLLAGDRFASAANDITRVVAGERIH
jgi:hypothetical protein